MTFLFSFFSSRPKLHFMDYPKKGMELMVLVYICRFGVSLYCELVFILHGKLVSSLLQVSTLLPNDTTCFHQIRYGEGWDFGEVAKNGRGINASQFNLSGTGIGR